ncbi:MAG: type II toxin-antitoxin system RelE/ParE family toxin [Rhodobacteraceae bacterium]|nr:type II toxin-antitoxin system RelE/ParE family toxin [Paracoccaceae bacterium]
MSDLEWKATTIADLLTIVDYISDDNPVAAQALKDEIEDKTSRLVEHPQMYRVGRIEGTRELWSCAETTSSSMPKTPVP